MNTVSDFALDDAKNGSKRRTNRKATSFVKNAVKSSYNIKPSTESICFHCGLPVPAERSWKIKIQDQMRQFCCPSCKMVCSAIHDNNLQGFYDRTPNDLTLTPPPQAPKDLALYDLDEIQTEFVGSLTRERTINLLVEGIHCAACVWLIERSLSQVTGVLKTQVNLSGRRLSVSWDNDEIHLSEIIQQLSQIGYAAVPYDPDVAEGVIKKQNRAMLLRMSFAGFAMMNLLWVSIALYSGADQGEFKHLFYWVGFTLATPTLFYSGYPFLKGAIMGLKQGHLSMDLPIAIGATITYAYSVYITFSPASTGEVYYDTVVNFIFVILVGRYLEAMSKRQAVSSTQRLLDLQPKGATLVCNGIEKTVPIRSVKVGDTVLVKAGDKVPVDGVISKGEGSIDESMLSGESLAVHKKMGDNVSAGTMNIEGALFVTVVATQRDTALGRIILLVEEAQQSKAPIQCLADRIVPWFVLLTLSLATLTYFLWSHLGPEYALMAATAVLIITCPCAFGLATPMSIAVASGLAARNGVLVKSSHVFENLSQVDHVVFDKTGTLTEGAMHVQEIITLDENSDQNSELGLLRLAAALERLSEHSIASAIVNKAKQVGLDFQSISVSNYHNQPGYGISATIDQQSIILGNMAWLTKNNIQPNSLIQHAALKFEKNGLSCVYIAIDGDIVGLISIADKLRSDAKALIETLRENDISITLLSGDRQPVCDAIAKEIGGELSVIAEVLPEDKDAVIAQLQKQGKCVAMVGDGINDAPALMRADVGIAIGSGTDVSIDSADIVLMSDELLRVWSAIELSKCTLKTIRQNIGISFVYNVIMVPVAIAALITPLIAAIAMPISSLAVIGNSARIRRVFSKKGAK